MMHPWIVEITALRKRIAELERERDLLRALPNASHYAPDTGSAVVALARDILRRNPPTPYVSRVVCGLLDEGREEN